jgi:uncharacterized protein
MLGTMPLPKLVIAGAGGVIGRALLDACRDRYTCVVLTRGGTELPGSTSVRWAPDAAERGDEAELERLALILDGTRAMVNLAGASIADGRLDDDHVRRVRDSRLRVAATLVAASRRASAPPAVWFQASGVDIYGDRGETILDEDASVAGDALMSLVGRAWEASAEPARGFARVLIGRMGVVLAPEAPAWRRLLLPIRLFVGGPLGSGRQWFPWIEAGDLARAIIFLIESPEAEGVHNLVAEPVRQVELARAAARRLRRPALVPVPAFVLRIVVGRLADTLLLSSKRVVPRRLRGAGFTFEAGTLEEALPTLLP